MGVREFYVGVGLAGYRAKHGRSSALQGAEKEQKIQGFSLGHSVMLATMKLAPQSLRTYSLTMVTANRRRLFQVAATANLFIEILAGYRVKGSFDLYAFVVMPDHVHLLLTPAPLVPIEKAVQLIKGGFSFRLKSKSEVWERGYFDRRIPDRNAFHTAKTYIEQNPLRARLVSEVTAYPYSSVAYPEMVDPQPKWFA